MSEYRTVRNDDEVDEVLNAAGAQIEQGATKYSGLTYEDGVDAGIRWLTGHDDASPMED